MAAAFVYTVAPSFRRSPRSLQGSTEGICRPPADCDRRPSAQEGESSSARFDVCQRTTFFGGESLRPALNARARFCGRGARLGSIRDPRGLHVTCEAGNSVAAPSTNGTSAEGSGSSEPSIVVKDVSFSWERHAAAAKIAAAGATGVMLDLKRSETGAEYRYVLDSVSLEIPRGQVWMLLGSNGSGKSTMMQLFLGLARPDKGSIRIRAPVGYVHQNPDHQVFMPTVGSDVAFGLANTGLSTAELRRRVADALELVGLPGFENRPVYTLSGGQKSRVAIAGSLVRNCNTLLLDEPTAFLDPAQRRSLGNHVRRIARTTGIAALWITHYFEELDFCDGAVLLDKGRVVCRGPPDVVRKYIRANYKYAEMLPDDSHDPSEDLID